MPSSNIQFTGNDGYLQAAMSGLAARQRAIANNVANVDTPNFKASEVRFEDALKCRPRVHHRPADIRQAALIGSTARVMVSSGLPLNTPSISWSTFWKT